MDKTDDYQKKLGLEDLDLSYSSQKTNAANEDKHSKSEEPTLFPSKKATNYYSNTNFEYNLNNNISSSNTVNANHAEPQLERRETFAFTNKVNLHFGPDQSSQEYQAQNKLFGDNSVSTTKYNVFSWFPKSLLMQFKRIANIYFLIISILTLMPFSPKNPYSQTATFILVLIFTMIKEAYEDVKRYKQDKEINNKSSYIYDHKINAFVKRRWRDILVGDLIKVQ